MHTFRFLLVLLFLISEIPAEEQLRQHVHQFWEAMGKQDKYRALQYVLPESRNAFIQRREFLIRNWKLEEIRAMENGKAQVVLSGDRLMEGSGTFYPTRIHQSWIYQDGSWYLSVPRGSSKKIHELLYGLNPPNPIPEGEVRVAPGVIKLSFLNPVQRGAIVIRNGLEEPVRIVDLKVDQRWFKIEEDLPDSIEPGSESKIYLRYLGSEEEKDLESEALLILEWENREREYPVQILYNHISAQTKAFFGLTDEEAKNLKKGEKLTPRLKIPANAGQPPPALPEELFGPDSDEEGEDLSPGRGAGER